MKNLIVIVMMVVTGFSVMAQPNKGPEGKKFNHEEKMSDRLEYMTIVLDLTETQVTKIEKMQAEHAAEQKAIREKYKPVMEKMKDEMKSLKDNESLEPKEKKEKIKAIRENYKPQTEPMKAEMKASKDKFDTNFESVLNASQKEKYNKLKALKEAKKEEMKKEGFRGKGDFKGKAPHQKRQIEERPSGIE